jgi:hypothetical protein
MNPSSHSNNEGSQELPLPESKHSSKNNDAEMEEIDQVADTLSNLHEP